MIRLAAFQPDIAANLGAMIRTTACFGVPLDVIEPCGFPFSVKSLRRAAMDYATFADIHHHYDWDAFLNCHNRARIVLLTTGSQRSLWNFNFDPGDIVVVGQESAGVTDEVKNRADAAVCLPMPGGGRSLNVAISAGIALAEGLRQCGHWSAPHAKTQDPPNRD